MQTFLTDINFQHSASMLDSLRLNKQLIECFQIYQVMQGKSKAWENHPVIRMWENHQYAFLSYCFWVAKETTRRKINNKYIEYFITLGTPDYKIPTWLDKDFCNRHRSALLFKTALKATVYDYSFLYDVPISQINKTNDFIGFINTHDKNYYLSSDEITKHYPVGKSIYHDKKVASVRMISTAYTNYRDYKKAFGNLPHKIDYRWG